MRMLAGSLLCSECECKKRFIGVNNMDFSELEEYCTKCSCCGSWILKDNDTANKTYQAISNKWAEEFMKEITKK